MILIIAGIFGASSIAIGAYGAHGLKKKTNSKTYQSFKNAVQYQQLHSIVLLFFVALSQSKIDSGISGMLLEVSSWFMIAGILLFSGSIYASIFMNNPKWTKITPAGGICFIVGWLLLSIVGVIYRM